MSSRIIPKLLGGCASYVQVSVFQGPVGLDSSHGAPAPGGHERQAPMKQTHDGLTLSSDPPDAVMLRNASGKGVSVTAALEPASPNNAVCVQYRIDGGPVRDLRAVAVRIDYQRNL